MSRKYYSVFPDGLTETIIKILQKQKVSSKILEKGSNYIVFSSSKNPNEIASLDFFEVTFLLINFFRDKFALQNQLDWCNNNVTMILDTVLGFVGPRRSTFRIVASRKDGDKAEFNAIIESLEAKLSRRISIYRGHPDFEIRLVEKDSHGFIGIRITKPPEYIDEFQKNSVRKEIAYILNYLSDPQSSDIVLDPFCGGGMIPLLRSECFPYKKIIASDINTTPLRSKLKKLNSRVHDFILLSSSLNDLPFKVDAKVNKIITDPPWGLVQKISNIEEFYGKMLDVFISIAEAKSVLIILTPHEQIIRAIVANKPEQFSVEKSIKTKVSGYDSVILKIIIRKSHT